MPDENRGIGLVGWLGRPNQKAHFSVDSFLVDVTGKDLALPSDRDL